MAIENQKHLASDSYLCEDYFIKNLFENNITWLLSKNNRVLFDELFKIFQGEWDMVLDSVASLSDTSYLFKTTWKNYKKTIMG